MCWRKIIGIKPGLKRTIHHGTIDEVRILMKSVDAKTLRQVKSLAGFSGESSKEAGS
jgi:hypothetical protein